MLNKAEFEEKYRKSSNIVKCYYNLKQLFNFDLF